MVELIRDTALGKLIRITSCHRLLLYPEECGDYLRGEFAEAAFENANSSAELGINEYATEKSTSEAIASGSPCSNPNQKLAPKTCPDTIVVVGWRKNDSENPQNWSVGKKLFVSTLIWVLTFSVYIGSAIYSPGIPGVAEEFGVSNVASTLGLTLFVLGYGIGPMIWSPLSEIPTIGRSPVYLLTLLAFVLLNFAVVYAKNFAAVLVFRFLTGFIGSPALATGGASMGDIWSPRVADYMIVVWGAFAIAAPVLGPMVGGFAYSAKGWTWTIWQLIWVSTFAFVLLFVLMPETYGPTILYHRARRIRKTSGSSSFCSEAELEFRETSSRDIIFEALIRPFQLCFLEPIVLVMNIYIAFVYGILYIWFEAFPIIFEEVHGFNPGQSGMSFLGTITGTICFAIPGYFSWKYFYQSKRFNQDGTLPPEEQLPPACFGSICLPVSLFWFGWTGNFESVHWIVPIIASGLFSVGGCLIFNCIFCYQTHAYPKYAASVLAGNDLLRSSFGAGFPLFATAMFHELGVGWACTLLGCVTCLFVPYPFILYWRGKQLRLRSKYARHDI
ncbi:hypothetical protein ASPZODRAFT_152227 [Penicilliopsis zonata CBS 506.65]|uniref:Major facilitator superfamily (MFS) profile domain-containing protein n=1 Tax=Penicilliopsis zonata CBS 506.65 TaxID=1073090 RepID=A0A1L9SFC4_9EURO|nr:hypothetical protein ASPZODRAFT_152227 [Penicilliopsis zonata CBS 506.65]OJJ45975.1 hypothetical protein ASPZODRAFT_152227 [Penicilliopsis zonata CBS 506.65]